MLSALIRPVEVRTVEISGVSLADVHEQLDAQTPPGFVLATAPVSMAAGSSELSATAAFHRVDGVREIEAPDMASLEALVPEGWRMLSIRRS